MNLHKSNGYLCISSILLWLFLDLSRMAGDLLDYLLSLGDVRVSCCDRLLVIFQCSKNFISLSLSPGNFPVVLLLEKGQSPSFLSLV